MEELGDVSGRTILHLQCHFGLDTMSWTRPGATATGVDFSEEAISLARSLSRELGIGAMFVLPNIYGLPVALDEKYDIVFTSYGMLSWLPDLAQWAKVAVHFLRLGGTYYMAEMHLFLDVFDERESSALKVHFSYFGGHPTRYEADGTYADTGARVVTPTYQSEHSLGEVGNSLIGQDSESSSSMSSPTRVIKPFRRWTAAWPSGGGCKELNDSIPQTFSLEAIKE